jgi:acyl-coenzyme A synthetase/AMP-(fatty) acid ligase
MPGIHVLQRNGINDEESHGYWLGTNCNWGSGFAVRLHVATCLNVRAKRLEAELILFCRKHLSPIKCPKSIDFEAELPRTPTGKLVKRHLRDRYWPKPAAKL